MLEETNPNVAERLSNFMFISLMEKGHSAATLADKLEISDSIPVQYIGDNMELGGFLGHAETVPC
ncbi:hypothetical protein SETIT_8G214600v2 [Setaria italica]|uniref:Uncharacterized protein n=1 Tax=Setaria italica TaxID=4555 RepID=A0A368SAD4_SETIT|nr:hypothetical protein SETIT_8G214600v2 [Setaria italica]